MKVAITGASGFVGQYTVMHLQEVGYDIIALSRDVSKLDNLFNNSIEKRETDFSIDSLNHVLKDADIIVHLAAKRLQKDLDPLLLSPYIDGNIICTQNLLKAAQNLNIQRFCFISSIAVYSTANQLPFVESEAPVPISIYGVSKIACESLGNLFNARTNVKVTNLRLSSLFGHGEKAGVVFTDYVNLAKAKKTLKVWGKGKTTIDFLYIKDAVRAIEKAIDENAPSGTFNIGSNYGYSVKEIAETINDVFDNKGNLEFLLDKKEGGYKVYMDASKVQKRLNWKPNWSLLSAVNDIKNFGS